MSTPNVAEPEAVNFETSFHLDRDVENPDNYLVIHELMGRGQLLNAYEVRPHHPQKPNDDIDINIPAARARLAVALPRACEDVSGDAIFASLLDEADVSFASLVTLPRPQAKLENQVRLPPSKSREIATSTLLPCRRSIARARARSRASSARVPDASSLSCFRFRNPRR